MDMIEKAEQIKAMTEALGGADSQQAEIMRSVSELLCELAGVVQSGMEQAGDYEIECPNCGETLAVSEEDLDAGEVTCPECNAVIELTFSDEEDSQNEDADPGYELTCPECGNVFEADEEALLSGTAKCPECGTEQEI